MIRPATPSDAPTIGRICHDAFAAINAAHNFPPDFPTLESAIAATTALIAHPGFHAIVAEHNGTIIGSNFLDERSPIAGIGPITVDPAAQNRGIGRALMQAVLARAAARNAPGVRLCQAAYHLRSLSLYASLGFRVREPLAVIAGPPLNRATPGHPVRPATPADLPACNTLCTDIHGIHRGPELQEAVARNEASVVERDGRITAYTTGIAFFAHSVARTNADLAALIAAAPAFGGPGFLLPTRNHELFAWCLAQGLRVTAPMTLMSIGLYNTPTGAFLPSILY